MLCLGIRVEKDEQKAFEWHKKAAEQGNADAQYYIAVCYVNGTGVEQDEQKAAEQGNGRAQFYFDVLILICYKDEQKAFEWCKKAAEQAHASAQYNLAN